jgi:hypothetical protein
LSDSGDAASSAMTADEEVAEWVQKQMKHKEEGLLLGRRREALVSRRHEEGPLLYVSFAFAPTQPLPHSSAMTADEEVAEWVQKQMKHKEEGLLHVSEKPALPVELPVPT